MQGHKLETFVPQSLENFSNYGQAVARIEEMQPYYAGKLILYWNRITERYCISIFNIEVDYLACTI